jgi:hypothetical protein
LKRLRLILDTELTRNKIQANESLAVPVLNIASELLTSA